MYLKFRWLLHILLLTLFVSCSNEGNKKDCTSNSECSTEKVCKESKCIDIECTSEKDCRGGYLCKDKKCQKPAPCPEKEKGGCCEDSHCQKDQRCADKKCVAKGCQEDKDCTDKQKPKCLAQKCVVKDSCQNKEDCKDPTKPECKEGKCITPAEAKEGAKCGEAITCKKGLHCFSRVGQTFCRKPCDLFKAFCSAGSECTFIRRNLAYCLPRNGKNSRGQQCDTQACEVNLICIEWKNSGSICTNPCRPGKKDCIADIEICHDFGNIQTCVPKPDPCGPGRGCPQDWECKKNQCIPKACPNTPCPKAEVCRLGRCETLNCCKGDPCPGTKVCNHKVGLCEEIELNVPFCTACLSGNRCAQPSQRCLTLTDKDDKLCASECTASKKCLDPQMKCTQQKDKRWFCLPHLGTCSRDRCQGIKCGENELCLPKLKKCIKNKLGLCDSCTDDIQCGGPTDKCIIKGGEKTGFCSFDCSGCTNCPIGYTCSKLGNVQLCTPLGGSCKK